uniref:Fucolectin tachylectin-4 pentraxin-1 domain-containing protein n=1 Tax=Salvator merianae TaxID=96440 RepID=A0A8D0BQ13_SALMN
VHTSGCLEPRIQHAQAFGCHSPLLPGALDLEPSCRIKAFLKNEKNTPHPFSGIPGFNLARGRPACQSSVYLHEIIGSANKAVDGDCDGNYTQGSCTHTNGEANPWWYVDLGTSYAIAAVIVYNRADCCSERLRGAEVRVGNSVIDGGKSNALCGTIENTTDSASTLHCNWLRGRYVTIRIPRQSVYLMLCEVEVYGLVSENQC